MNYTLVDKNLLIPEIIISEQYFDIIIQLYKKVFKRDLDYCSNVYIIKYNGVKYESVIESDGNYIYETIGIGNRNENEKKRLDIDLNNIFIQHNKTKSEPKSEPKLIPINLIKEENTKSNPIEKPIEKPKLNPIEKPMQIVINEKIESSILIEEKKTETDEEKKKKEEKEKKKELLLKTCEQVMDLYNLELSNIKKTENQIKTLNSKLEKLEKKKQEQIIKDISRTKSDYETWKKLKYKIGRDEEELIYKPEEELELREDPTIPILFTAKYNYIDTALKNDKIKQIYSTLNKLNIDSLYIADSIDLDPNIIKFCEKYYKTAKNDLHYKFDHDWDYLDTEMNADSKGGSLSMFS